MINSYFKILIPAVIFCFGMITYAHGQSSSNQAVIFNAIAEHIRASINDFPEGRTYAVSLDHATPQSLQQIQTVLLGTGLPLSTNFENSLLIKIQVVSSNRLIHQKRNLYQRNISADAGITVSDSEGNILKSMSFEIDYTDELTDNGLQGLESDWMPSRFSERRSRRLFARIQRYVEPIVITSAVATTVYLLYNIRSQ